MNSFNREPGKIPRAISNLQSLLSNLYFPCPSKPLTTSNTHSLANIIADRGLTTAIFIALTLDKPLFVEGEPGVGKTEIARVLARALDTRSSACSVMKGWISVRRGYEWNYPRQILEIRLLEAEGGSCDAARQNIFSEDFLLNVRSSKAIENHSPENGLPPVLLIDELDRADEEFPAFSLLELLSRLADHCARGRNAHRHKSAQRHHHLKQDV